MVEALAEAGGAHDDAFSAGEGFEAVDLMDDLVRWGGKGEGAEAEKSEIFARCVMSYALVVEVVVDLAGCRRGGGRGEEVEPGVCEGDDGAGYPVGLHEGQLGVEGGVARVYGPTTAVEGFGGVIVGGEDDKTRW